MTKISYKYHLIILIHLICISTTYTSSAQNSLNIIPTPQIEIMHNGNFAITNSTTLSIQNNKPNDRNQQTKFNIIAEIINNTIHNKYNLSLNISRNNKIKNNYIEISLIDSASFFNNQYPLINNEGYYLNISNDNISIKSISTKGLFYGAMSLIQIIENSNNQLLPTCNIIDWPSFKIRGISDDISRGQVSNLDNFKKTIQNLAKYKMNTYMLYIEDMMLFDSYPSIGQNRGALSKQEIAEIVKFANIYNIDVIPIFQTLGHYENILAQPEFYKYAEFPGAASINISDDSIYIFLDNMICEVAHAFPSEYIHIGADESFDVGLGKSKKLVEKSDLATVHDNHYNKIYDICKKYNKNVMIYSDIILENPKIIDLIPKDITIVDWHYSTQDYETSTSLFAKNNFNYIISPSVWNFYCIMPINFIALPNIKYLSIAGYQNKSIGMINSNWGDFGAETFKELNLFGYAWSAQCAWKINSADIDKFSDIFIQNTYQPIDINTANNIKDIYIMLSSPPNQIVWHDFWRHPLSKKLSSWPDNSKIQQKILWLEWTINTINNKINDAEKNIKQNNDYLNILKFIIHATNFYKYKLQTSLLINDLINNKISNKDSILYIIDENINLIQHLKIEFNNIWLKYYKPDNLNLINLKFDRLTQYFKEIQLGILNNSLKQPEIESKWIYLKKPDNQNFFDSASFSKIFYIDNTPDSAFLQLIADTYAKLYINDSLIDSVFARKMLSLIIEHKRIRIIDIKPFLKQGENKITVVTQNFEKKGAAGCNIYSEIYYSSNNKQVISKIISDNSWDATTTINPKNHPKHKKHQTIQQNQNIFKNKATEKQYPHTVIAPNFKTKRTSWIER